MNIKQFDEYHRKQIYGAKMNLLRASKKSLKKIYWTKVLNALRKSAKQVKKNNSKI